MTAIDKKYCTAVPSDEEIVVLSHLLGADDIKEKLWRWQFSGGEGYHSSLTIQYDGKLVGFNGLMPTRFWNAGEESLMYWSCDFIVRPEYRGQGVGVGLKRELIKRYCDNPIASFGISDSAFPLLLSHGWKQGIRAGEYRWQKKTVNLRGAIKLFIQFVNKSIGSTVEIFSDRNQDFNSSISMNLPKSTLIDSLWHESKVGYSCIVTRDYKYLDWKYQQHPLAASHYQYLCVRNSANNLQAILILRREGECLYIVDYLGPAKNYSLKRYILKSVFQNYSEVLSISMVSTDPEWLAVSKYCGFHATRNFRRFVVRDHHSNCSDNWFLMRGDSDGELLLAAKYSERS